METKTIDVSTTPPNLADLLALVSTVDEIILSKGATPIARITPIEPATQHRVAGLHPNAMQMRDDFDAPLPEDFWIGKP
jgi:antitoxin (DNA-binding transcriptional repressor) of toxin-antitoxin stability system